MYAHFAQDGCFLTHLFILTHLLKTRYHFLRLSREFQSVWTHFGCQIMLHTFLRIFLKYIKYLNGQYNVQYSVKLRFCCQPDFLILPYLHVKIHAFFNQLTIFYICLSYCCLFYFRLFYFDKIIHVFRQSKVR